MNKNKSYHPDTLAVRGGVNRSPFDETAEALYLTSGYVYGSAQEAADAFSGDIDRKLIAIRSVSYKIIYHSRVR